MSQLILAAVSSVPTPVVGDEMSVSALMIMAGVYMGTFAPILGYLWQQSKASIAAAAQPLKEAVA